MFDQLRTWASRMVAALRMRRVDGEFSEELHSHLTMLTEENVRRGMSPAEARRQALLRLGGMTQLRESHREQRGLPLVERLGQDVRYALRMFRKSPGFTLFAGAALALGIGGSTAVFSVANAVLLRPLPYKDPARLVSVWVDDTPFGFPRNNGTPWNYMQWRERNHVLDDIAALTFESVNLTGSGNPERLESKTVTANFFSVLGVPAALGRTLVQQDGVPGTPLAAVISHGLWVRRFGSDPQIIGKDLVLDGAKYTVVGVMPANFHFLDRTTEIWTPAQWTPKFLHDRQTSHFLTMVARLKPGVSVERANAEMAVLGKQLATNEISDMTAVVVPLREQLTGNARPAILMLLAAVGFVLLIACANLANLLLARGTARSREMAVRVALGASRRRVIGQMLTESLLLSLGAGAIGLALAAWLTRFLGQLLPPGIGAGDARLDLPVLAFTAAASIATGLAFGILPSLRASRVELSNSLKQGTGQGGVGAAGRRLRHVLVVTEVALAIVLLAGAALMIRSFSRMYHQDPGFSAEHVLTLQTPLPRPKYAEFARRSEFYREVLQRVETLPGVVAAGYSTYLPLANSGGGSLVSLENHPFDPRHMLISNVRVVSPDYFRAIGMKLVRGRLLERNDGPDSLKVAVINETMARTYWPGEDPVGQRFKRGLPGGNDPWYLVVGIVADMRQGGMSVPVRPEAYFTFEQADFFAPDSLAVRTTGEPMAVAEEVRREILAVDKDEPVADIAPLADAVDESVAPARMQAWLLGSVAAMALLLTSLGIYGVLSFAVAQRRQEIGVRMALGARPGDVLQMVVGQGLTMLAIGLAIGLVAAFALTRLMAHLLFEVRPSDPLSYLIVTALLALVTLLACYLPARRAMRVEPMIALRYE